MIPRGHACTQVALAVLYKWYHPTFMYHVSLASFVW